ncbi:MAG TPA: folylpolyglutamate synthase/dihydrofolate synthase family protein [Anaerolineaceae bacterium]|nr:bifunctional folylpolyglutamate synthase/dihydrofolate synthase [Chloroflexota bacterium]HNY84020.1 folylpolyglutamate synthase/dihydrofolate synthase family protein [Anaerolineaceae bacterium]
MTDCQSSDLETRYNAALDFIYSFIDFSMKRHVDDTHRFFKLDRMNKLMGLLDDPHHKFPTVHVAGTKGKGSTASFIASALEQADYKVGLYTSPHLVEFTERIQINRQHIEQASLISLTDLLRPLTLSVPEITTFELTTALAFQYFAQEKVDIAVIEVGLGGRLDATNVIIPQVSVITSISYDHTAVLGNTLTEIAYEKGGIIKPEVPVVIAPQKPEALTELVRIAQERSAAPTLVEKELNYQEVSHTLHSQTIIVHRSAARVPKRSQLTNSPLKLEIPLLGHHQIENAATAVAALEVLRKKGWRLTRKSVRRSFAQVAWPTRFEILRESPPVVLDSAHNGDSMERLRETLDEYFPNTPFILVFGASADKEMKAMLDAILPRVEMVITTRSIHPRAKDSVELKALVEPYGLTVIAIDPAEAALAKALELAGAHKGVIVSGSMFIASAGREIYRSMGL